MQTAVDDQQMDPGVTEQSLTRTNKSKKIKGCIPYIITLECFMKAPFPSETGKQCN